MHMHIAYGWLVTALPIQARGGGLLLLGGNAENVLRISYPVPVYCREEGFKQGHERVGGWGI